MSLALCFWTLGCWILTATVFPSCSTALWTCAKEAAPWGFSSKERNNSDNWRRQRGDEGLWRERGEELGDGNNIKVHTHTRTPCLLASSTSSCYVLDCLRLCFPTFASDFSLPPCLFHTLRESISGPITIKSAEKFPSQNQKATETIIESEIGTVNSITDCKVRT